MVSDRVKRLIIGASLAVVMMGPTPDTDTTIMQTNPKGETNFYFYHSDPYTGQTLFDPKTGKMWMQSPPPVWERQHPQQPLIIVPDQEEDD